MKHLLFLALLIALAHSPALASPTTISNPCALGTRFLEVHAKISKISEEAYDIVHTASHIHHTSRWRPYRHTENEWSDMHARVLSTLVELSDFPIALDPAQEGKRKDTALMLVSAYQNALEKLTDYAAVAMYLERTESDLSNNVQPQFLSFGVSKMEVPTTYNSIAQNHSLAQFSRADDALRSLTIPERRYSTLCGVPFKNDMPLRRQFPS